MLNTSHPVSSPLPQKPPRQGAQPLFGLLGCLRVVLGLISFAAVLFLSAGRWDLPMFWAYWLALCVFVVATLALVNRKGPDLLQERFRPGPGARDDWTRPLVLPFTLGHWVVAGLDVGRYHWSEGIPLAAQIGGLFVCALGLAGWAWAMLSNQFFSSAVRIQIKRGHHVVSGGPYRFVRHPGYASAMLVFGASAVALGSLWALVPALGFMVIFLRRTKLEDRILQAELSGYAEYVAQVRFRLLPGVW